ncbi:MAG: hypothetical protein K8S99_13890 [Planctomycetes bacterium]|nr:hypothetical protein [Planctomycetota bacterium]
MPRTTHPNPPAAPRRITALVLLIVALAGCHAAHVEQPLTRTLASNDTDAQMEFWHALALRPMTSNDEAFHGLLLYTDNQDPAADYAGRIALLKARRMLPGDFDRPADEAVSRGTLAVALVKVLNIKGGVVMRVIGPGPHYATRELQYEGLYPPSSENQTFSGSEFVGVIGRIEDYQRSNPAEYRAKVLPSEADKAAGIAASQPSTQPATK